MKVIGFQGSPRLEGNTARLVERILGLLRDKGIETERIDLCPSAPRGCTGCMQCFRNKNRRCVIETDPLNTWVEKAATAEGILIAAPTYFANVPAETKALLDRMGLVARANGHLLRRKVGAGVVAVRRAGAGHALDAIHHMFQISQMLIPCSSYWNFAVGRNPGDVEGDEEGLRTMDDLAENMAWLLGKVAG